MAAAINYIKSSASKAGNLIKTHGTTYYKQILERNEKYIVREPTVEKCQELSKQLFYTQLASIPGRYNVLQKEWAIVKQKAKNINDLPITEIGLGALFAGELAVWFFVGEIVGRGSISGYKY